MVVRNGCMNPASVQPDPGGKLRPAWPADSTVTSSHLPHVALAPARSLHHFGILMLHPGPVQCQLF